MTPTSLSISITSEGQYEAAETGATDGEGNGKFGSRSSATSTAGGTGTSSTTATATGAGGVGFAVAGDRACTPSSNAVNKARGLWQILP